MVVGWLVVDARRFLREFNIFPTDTACVYSPEFWGIYPRRLAISSCVMTSWSHRGTEIGDECVLVEAVGGDVRGGICW